MKFTTLKFMYLLVFGLLVYSCTQEELFTTEKEPGLQLVSPDGFQLAESTAGLRILMKETLDPVFGEDYQFEILNIKYSLMEKLTNAEIIFNVDGGQRNMMFYWTYADDSATARSASILKAAPFCSGDCPMLAGQPFCTTVVDEDLNYSCSCGNAEGILPEGCKITIPADPDNPKSKTRTWTCTKKCRKNDNTPKYPCLIQANLETRLASCYCPVSANANQQCGGAELVANPEPLED